jgi:hypothetical protein
MVSFSTPFAQGRVARARMLSKTMRRARTAAAICLLLSGCQSAVSRGVSARTENSEVNLSFTIENNLLRLDTVTLDNRAGRYFLGSAHPRTLVHPTFLPGQPRHSRLSLNGRATVSVDPIYVDLSAVGDAIVGFDAWSPHAITINYVEGLVTYQKEGIHPDGMTLFRYEDEPAIAVTVDGRRVPAAIDTAIPDTLILPRGAAAPGRTTVRVEIAGTVFENVDVALADVSRARIGNRLLSKFLVSIDYEQRRVGLWRDPRIPIK